MNEQSENDGKMKGIVRNLDESPERQQSTERGESETEILRALIEAETFQFNTSQRDVIFKMVISVAWFLLGICIVHLAYAILLPILTEIYHYDVSVSSLLNWLLIYLILMVCVIMSLLFGIRDHCIEWKELQEKSNMLEKLHKELMRLLADDGSE